MEEALSTQLTEGGALDAVLFVVLDVNLWRSETLLLPTLGLLVL